MKRRALGTTGIDIGPLVFGGNVLGWTVDKQMSLRILDAFVDHGFNAIDTADVYTAWVPGNKGGDSETIIGQWLGSRPSLRDKVVLFTKVGSSTDGTPLAGGLSKRAILNAVEGSLKRLRTDVIDLYFSHWHDESTPLEETLGAYAGLLQSGKIRSIGASNVNANQLEAALQTGKRAGLPGYQVIQPEYNLYSRSTFDGNLREICIREGLGVVSYYSLASGFLTGKYRSPEDLDQSPRGRSIGRYLNKRGMNILDALDSVAARHGAKLGEVALAWLMASKGVTAPIASATTISQIENFAKAAQLRLEADDLGDLDQASK